MKAVKWFVASSLCVVAFSWATRIYSHFFVTSQADYFGLFLVSIVGLLAATKLRSDSKRPVRNGWILIIITVPFLLFPAINYFLTITDLSWIAIHFYMMVITASVILFFDSKWLIGALISVSIVHFIPYNFQKEQLQFYDRVEAAIETRQGAAQIANWKDDYWLYYNKQLQYSTVDRHMYQEAYIQPVFQLVDDTAEILLIGGENGALENELSKFSKSIQLTHLVLDSAYERFMTNNPLIDLESMESKELVFESNPHKYLSDESNRFDLVIIDVPDPEDVFYQQFYKKEFYQLCEESLQDSGLLVTHTGDYYRFKQKADEISNSLIELGFEVIPYHCQIPTIGQWSWVIASKAHDASEIREKLADVNQKTETTWWNQEAMDMMLSFGKSSYFDSRSSERSN